MYLAVITSMFLHGGILHLGFNMLFLWVFGNNVEDRLGWALYLLFYVLAGIFATIGQVLLDPSSTVPVIGAVRCDRWGDGRVLGVVPESEDLHALLRHPRVVQRDRGACRLLACGSPLQFIFNRGGDVAWMAHVAGFAFGVAVAWDHAATSDDRAAVSDPWSPPSPYR